MIAKNRKLQKDSSPLLPSIFFFILIVLITFFLVSSNWKMSQKRTDYSLRIRDLEAQIRDTQKKIDDSQSQISQSQSNDYLKEKLYEQGYVEKGEKQVIVLPPKNETSTPQANSQPPANNWWERLKNKLK